jgi:hypothetical protein
MQKTKQFTAVVQGATLQSDLTLGIPSEDYSFWLFKPGRAIVYFESVLVHNRQFF